jgi:hypothetical protein
MQNPTLSMPAQMKCSNGASILGTRYIITHTQVYGGGVLACVLCACEIVSWYAYVKSEDVTSIH